MTFKEKPVTEALLYSLFLKHSLKHIPVVSKTGLLGFIHKEKLLRYSHQLGIKTGKDIGGQEDEDSSPTKKKSRKRARYSKLAKDDFTQDIKPFSAPYDIEQFYIDVKKNTKAKVLPVIQVRGKYSLTLKPVSVEYVTQESFFQRYKPATSLKPKELLDVLINHSMPSYILNTEAGLIWENKAAKNFRLQMLANLKQKQSFRNFVKKQKTKQPALTLGEKDIFYAFINDTLPRAKVLKNLTLAKSKTSNKKLEKTSARLICKTWHTSEACFYLHSIVSVL